MVVIPVFIGTKNKMRISKYFQNKDTFARLELRIIIIVNYLLPYLNPIIITDSQHNLNQKCRIS